MINYTPYGEPARGLGLTQSHYFTSGQTQPSWCYQWRQTGSINNPGIEGFCHNWAQVQETNNVMFTDYVTTYRPKNLFVNHGYLCGTL